ncbi:MAG TPA: deoxyribose-phosphate aldolase [Gemmatimonadales bacterium]
MSEPDGPDPLARSIEHTLLRPGATRADIEMLCDEAARFGVHGVCVNGAWTALCAGRLAGTPLAVVTVVGFPLGAAAPAAKACEAHRAAADGAAELDMVIALGHAKAGEWRAVEDDIRAVVGAAGPARVKAILETAALTTVEIASACRAAVAAGAAFVKTSTGFHRAGGASVDAVRLMRETVGPAIGIKASGGIRTRDAALEMLAAGADRIGTSATLALLGVR